MKYATRSTPSNDLSPTTALTDLEPPTSAAVSIEYYRAMSRKPLPGVTQGWESADVRRRSVHVPLPSPPTTAEKKGNSLPRTTTYANLSRRLSPSPTRGYSPLGDTETKALDVLNSLSLTVNAIATQLTKIYTRSYDNAVQLSDIRNAVLSINEGSPNPHVETLLSQLMERFRLLATDVQSTLRSSVVVQAEASEQKRDNESMQYFRVQEGTTSSALAVESASLDATLQVLQDRIGQLASHLEKQSPAATTEAVRSIQDLLSRFEASSADTMEKQTFMLKQLEDQMANMSLVSAPEQADGVSYTHYPEHGKQQSQQQQPVMSHQHVVDEQRGQIQKLQDEKQTLLVEHTRLSTQVQTLHEDVSRLETRKCNLEKVTVVLEAQRDSLRTDVNDLKTQQDGLVARINELREQYEQMLQRNVRMNEQMAVKGSLMNGTSNHHIRDASVVSLQEPTSQVYLDQSLPGSTKTLTEDSNSNSNHSPVCPKGMETDSPAKRLPASTLSHSKEVRGKGSRAKGGRPISSVSITSSQPASAHMHSHSRKMSWSKRFAMAMGLLPSKERMPDDLVGISNSSTSYSKPRSASTKL
ncbi:Blt1 [Schizosaccharomyces japonicus yFS275]|uniref:Blt1 n=1 Tax=Schizosaccharomyces japonicus (strain yFS275 / FY16936) TaxID=402676 RepID=B6K4K2_SCHJY|nr:Blt1 [Schizosaccharomyces japonicus yFS275]EEB08409.1 Blt1 [Schizosaccharomyces japonicus yFS275]